MESHWSFALTSFLAFLSNQGKFGKAWEVLDSMCRVGEGRAGHMGPAQSGGNSGTGGPSSLVAQGVSVRAPNRAHGAGAQGWAEETLWRGNSALGKCTGGPGGNKWCRGWASGPFSTLSPSCKINPNKYAFQGKMPCCVSAVWGEVLRPTTTPTRVTLKAF